MNGDVGDTTAIPKFHNSQLSTTQDDMGPWNICIGAMVCDDMDPLYAK